MKKMKMSLQSIQGVLSRDEMRQIMAGSEGGYCGQCWVPGTPGDLSDPGSSEACTRDVVGGCWCPNGAMC